MAIGLRDRAKIAKLSKDYVIKDIGPFGELSLVTYTLNKSHLDVGTNTNKQLKQHLKGLQGHT